MIGSQWVLSHWTIRILCRPTHNLRVFIPLQDEPTIGNESFLSPEGSSSNTNIGVNQKPNKDNILEMSMKTAQVNSTSAMKKGGGDSTPPTQTYMRTADGRIVAVQPNSSILNRAPSITSNKVTVLSKSYNSNRDVYTRLPGAVRSVYIRVWYLGCRQLHRHILWDLTYL